MSKPVRIANRFEVIRPLGQGAFAHTLLAHDSALNRKVALKVLHGGPFTGSKGRARFEREVAILAQLDHPNIVSIIDSGTAAGHAFYVMDYVSGQTLDAWMAGDPKPIEQVLQLFVKICDAVNAAHLKGITHRDLKPSNIRIDHSGEPHVLDFGLAKVVIGEVTEETQPQMMSITGQFETSHALLSQLQRNIIWGQKGNFLDVPTDCPQRDERLGWTGDAQVFCRTAAFNMDVASFFTKWLKDVTADQLENGSVPHVIPDVLRNRERPSAGAAGWADGVRTKNTPSPRRYMTSVAAGLVFIEPEERGVVITALDPTGLREEPLCAESYLRPLDECPVYTEYFKSGDDVPRRHCPIHRGSLKQRVGRAIEGIFTGIGRKIRDIFR